jgi:hypothetical protein
VVPTWAAAVTKREALARDGVWVAALGLPLLVAHQTEEWVRPGGFLEFSNRRLLGSAEPAWPLTERVGFHVNVTIGWTSAVAGVLLWRRTPAVAALVLGIEAGNVLMHSGMAAHERTANPGLGTAVLLFAPHVVLGVRWLKASGRMDRRCTVLAAAGAVAVSAGLPVLMKRRMRRRSRG